MPRFACRAFVFAPVILGLSLASPAEGQDSTRRARRNPAEPSAPHERMAVFEGTWTMAPGAYFESGPQPAGQGEETCAWLAGGRRHMVCRRWTALEGSDARREAINIMSFRGRDSTYIAHFAFPDGATLSYHGRFEGDRWVMDLQPSPLFPPTVRLRTIITPGPDGLRFVEEVSEDDGPWRVTEDYRYVRVRAP